MAVQPLRSGEAPAIVRPLSLDRAEHRSFLADVVIEHGPRDILGRLILQADTALREKGIALSFATCDELVHINRSNPGSWGPVVPVFNPDFSELDGQNCIALVGRNASGKPVLAHASRHYALGETTMKEELESLRLFYRDPAAMARPGEAIRSTSAKAAVTTGSTVYGGALWLHPEVRGKDVHTASGPLMRCLSHTKWDPEIVFSLMFPKLIEAGMAARWNLHAEFGVTLVNTPVMPGGSPELAFVWIDRHEQLDLFLTYGDVIASGRQTQVDAVVLDRAADQKLA